MSKAPIIVIIALAILFMVGLYLLSEMTGGTTFEERYSSIDRLTFSVGKGSILKQDLRVVLSYGNKSVEVQKANRTIIVDSFSWPNYSICPVSKEQASEQKECYNTPFTLIAIPKELLGVDSMEVPFPLAKNSKIIVNYAGVTSVDTPWGPHSVVNYTNMSVGFPQPNVNTTTFMYFDSLEGYVVEIDVSVTDGNLTSTAVYRLVEPPRLEGPLQIEKPEKWEWSGGS